jgi:Ca-activated chloride channel family protein
MVPILIGTYEYILGRTARRDTLRHTRLDLARDAALRSQWIRRRIPPLLFLLGVTALLLGAARPATVFLVPAQRGVVVLTMDVSLSMAATDVAPTRLAAAQAAAAQFVETIPAGIRIGVVAFGAYADVILAPTADKPRVLNALGRLKIQQFTALGTGLLTALLVINPSATIDPKYDLTSKAKETPDYQIGLMRGPPPPRIRTKDNPDRPPIDPSTIIILVSDGKGTMGVPALKAAELVADYGIRVYTIGVGTPYGGTAIVEGYPPTHAEFEEETLKAIADITRGKYSHASNLANFKSIYSDLAEGTVRQRKEIEVTAAFVAVGGILLLGGAALSLIWHHRIE